MLEERLPETPEVVYLANPNLTPDEILYAVAFELKLPVRSNTSKLLVMQQLQTYLLDRHGANRKVLIVIEEAQGMPVETLEEIRLFSNLETNRDKLMQIIMFGQPELDKNLSARNIRQLRDRITHSFYLDPLRVEEVSDYIRFRLGAAGCPCPKIFTPGAVWLISKASDGLTRRINILSDKALLAGYADAVLGFGSEELSSNTRALVTWKHAALAIKDSDYWPHVFPAILSPLKFAGTSMFVALIALTFLFWPRTSGVALQGPIDLRNSESTTGNVVAVSQSIETTVVEQALESDSGINDSTVPPASDAVPNSNPVSGKLLRQRLLASFDWLQNTEQGNYTVQFISGRSSNLPVAESFLHNLQEEGLIEETYVCMASVGAESYWAIKYGSFSSEAMGQRFVDTLPARVNEYAPFVQNKKNINCNSNNTIAALFLE
jgi:hypothetical protein